MTRTITPTPEDEAAWIKYFEDNYWTADAETLHLAKTDFLAGRASMREENEALRECTYKMIEAIKAGAIKSPMIGGCREVTPHQWHDEWLYHAEKALNSTETQDKGVG